MKTTNHKVQRLLLAVVLLGLGACTGDFEEINRNPNQVTEDQMEALNYKTGTKFKSLQSLVIPVEEHMYQFNESLSGGPFGGYIGATVDTWQTKFETYNPSADWRKWPFANVITETYTPYKGIVGGTDDEVAIAFARLLRVAIMHRVTDSYGTKFKSLQSLVIPVEEHMYQFNESLSGGPFGGYIGATVDTWQTKFETYNPSADWRKWPFANVITETYTPYKGIVGGTDDEVAIAFARLLRVAIMHRVTDSYGPIPYSQLESNESVYVAYDSQEAVYTKMFEELDEAIEILGRNTTLPAEAWSRYDAVYYGNIAQWLKYANSLKLRMAMRLSYVKPELAKAKAAEAIAGGVITANADNAAMHAAENRTTLIYNDWGDHRVGADILCYMTGYNDPRMEKMFLPNDVGDYVGIRIGIDVAGKSTAMAKYSNMIVESTTPYLWFNAAEATFLRAEYELRWGSEETAKTLYEQAVQLSFEERGASGAEAYLADASKKPAPYTDPSLRRMPTMRRCMPRRTARRSSTTTGATTASGPTSSAT